MLNLVFNVVFQIFRRAKFFDKKCYNSFYGFATSAFKFYENILLLSKYGAVKHAKNFILSYYANLTLMGRNT